ncbi:MAG: hypothetical protein LAO04_03745 [Acidobacteriia bacterium]|nr:hypothetical protein [Terriglobia bacterium]
MRRDQVAGGLCALVFLGCLSAHVNGQESCQEPQIQTLKVDNQGSITDFWRATKAEVSEDVTGVKMRLDMQNASAAVVKAGRFYADYYDASRQRCLTAMFGLSQNLEGPTAGVSPGETTTLFTRTYGLFPSCEPETIRVYRIPDDTSLHPSVPSPAIVVRRPPSVVATSRHATDTWQLLCLNQGAGAPTPAVLDLLLAEAEIDGSGHVAGMNVLNVISPQVQAWFQEFVPHLRFRPATEGLKPRSAETLLLVRAMMPSMRPGIAAPPPRDSDWVRQDEEKKDDNDPPWINVILLDRPVEEAAGGKETVPPMIPTSLALCFEYYGTGTEWSVDTADPQ